MRPFLKFSEQLLDLLRAGLYRDAMSAVVEYEKRHPNDNEFIYNRHGMIIDIGSGLSNADIVKEGLIDGLRILRELPTGKFASNVKYNVANGLYTLYGLKERSDIKAIATSKYLPRAKRFHRQALNDGEPTSTDKKCMRLVNLANVFSSLGRVVEAIYCYDEALSINPNFAMAKTNRAKALLYFVDITGQYRTQTYIEIYQQIQSAIDDPRLVEIGSIAARDHFRQIQKGIEDLFKDHSMLLRQPIEYKKARKGKMVKFEREYIEFCVKENLFLNFHLHNIESEEATYDVVRLQYIGHFSETGERFYDLARRLNQLLEDYVTSRFQLVQAINSPIALTKISKRTVYTNPLDYSRNDLQSGLLRSSFQNAYNILDKIAAFLNDYCALNIPDKKVSYTKLWEINGIKDALLGRDNLNICALYDIYRDFESKHYYPITEMRNALTHRQITILSINLPDDRRIDKNSITFDEFATRTTQLLRFVKSAIIYLVNFVNTEEEKKRKEGKLYIPMPVQTM